MKTQISFYSIVALILLATPAARSQAAKATGPWTHWTEPPASKSGAERWVQPQRGEIFQLDHATLAARLSNIRRSEPAQARKIGSELDLPMPDGTTARFVIVEAPVMAPELAAKFPEIKTYAGQGIDDPGATVRLDVSPAGVHAQVLSASGAVYVDPAYRGDADFHVSYYKRDNQRNAEDWNCLVPGNEELRKAAKPDPGLTLNKVQSGASLRTYRLAVACTGEYAAFFGGTVANAMAAIVTAVNRVDGVYETELAVRLVLVGNNNLIVYTNSSTDPYSNNNGSTMLSQNQTALNNVIGSANYDIGHVFSTGGGGVAFLACVCAANKAGGVTGSPAPTGDSFWIDYVAHEMGHQFGAEHTFNSSANSCGGGNRNPSTAFEPGSGLTIMAYAGICSPDDLQPHSDPFFHAGSLDEIQANLAASGGNCAVVLPTGNNPPTVLAGSSYAIPARTPFVLTASGSDPDGDALTYCWEEMDAGATATLAAADNGSMALFRDFVPTTSPVRYFPKLSSVLANTNWVQEKLPTTSRVMKFRVTARDNRVGGGGVADDQITVTSVSTAGPFVVTAPNTAVEWSGARTVTWNVAGTTSSPINTSGVNILLSTNGGLTFPLLLATNVPNTGAATVVLPNIFATQARILVQGTGNIFYDISDVNFSIIPGSAAPLVFLSGTTLVGESGPTTNGAADPYETVTFNWSLINVGSAPTTNLVATMLSTNGVYSASAGQTYGAIPAGGIVTRPFTFTLVGPCGGSVTGLVQLVDGTNDMGTVSAVFALGSVQTTVVTQSFSYSSPITIRDFTTAAPFPASISVSGVNIVGTKVTATLNGLSHTYPDDLGILLVGPGGQKVKLFGAAGLSTPVVGAVLTFDDSATVALPSSGSIPTGTYLPTDYNSAAAFSAPAPAGPYGSTLAPLAASPNGTWSLYVQDFASADSGSISGGWSLRFVTSNTSTNCDVHLPAPTLTSTTYGNGTVQFQWNALVGPHYQVQYATNLTDSAWFNLGDSILGTNTSMQITDSITDAPERYYRVLVTP